MTKMHVVVRVIILTVSWMTTLSAAMSLECPTDLWPGYDTRLDVTVVTSVEAPEKIVDVSLSFDRIVIAYEHAIVVYRDGDAVRVPVLPTVERLVVDKAGDLRVATSAGLYQVDTSGVHRATELKLPNDCIVENDGHAGTLCVQNMSSVANVSAYNVMGEAYALGTLDAPIAHVSWNEHGLAAIADQSLIIWEDGEDELAEIGLGLEGDMIRDLALTSAGTALVSSTNATWLISKESTTMIALTPSRVSVDRDRALILDLATGHLVTIQGLDKIGTRRSDERHLKNLTEALRQDPGNAAQALAEAVRLAGCDDVRRWLEQ